MLGLTTVQLPIFGGQNFSNWKFWLEAILEEKGLKEALDEEFDLTKDDNKKKDIKAKWIIVQCLSDKHLKYVNVTSANEMVKSLRTIFERKSIFNKLYLRKKLLTIKLGNNRMEDHFIIFDNIVRELESTRTKLDEDDKVCHLLITIPEKYETVITAMETIAGKLTLEFVKSRLLDAELKLKNDDEIDNNLDTSFFCFSCEKRGHKQFQCPERYQKTDKRGRGKLRNYCQRGRRSYNHRRGNYSNPGGAHQTNETSISFLALDKGKEAVMIGNDSEVHFFIDSGASDHWVWVIGTTNEGSENLRK